MTTFAMPPKSVPDTIRAASGGFVFADLGTNAVGFIDYSGNVVEYPLAYDGGANAPVGTNPGNATFVVQGPDGSFYFTDSDLARIGKITLAKKGLIFPETMTFPEPSTSGGTTNTQLVRVAVSGDRGPFRASTDAVRTLPSLSVSAEVFNNRLRDARHACRAPGEGALVNDAPMARQPQLEPGRSGG
jgi:hypothetical protein